jgi:hypothetical protein
MGKIITISLLAGWLASTSAFGQGWLHVASLSSQVWDGFTTPGVSTRTSNVNVGLFWAAANTANPMAGLLAFTPSNGNSTTIVPYTAATAWNTLLNASGWQLGSSTIAGGSLITRSTTKGAVAFAGGGGQFDLTGSTPGGDVALLEVSWNAAYANPTAAQAGGSAIGWSYLASVFAATGEHLGVSGTDVTAPIVGSLPNNFGTFVYDVPEPGPLSFAALGGLSLLIFRRYKK